MQSNVEQRGKGKSPGEKGGGKEQGRSGEKCREEEWKKCEIPASILAVSL